MKVLFILAENSLKRETKLFLLCAISYENHSQFQRLCELMCLDNFFLFSLGLDGCKTTFFDIFSTSKTFPTVLT